ncbi:hypothetical protein EH240_36900 [Mesorhizobium tamadayense]|uniref:Uncharacterized protein n=1 Tax=Mesorhizobium tamadayense TaxID=425306 RepID=A0A3P3EJ73_9HYPH|nr:hypothetical protein EH240_36900 [Mesorhizobium tamadayense]
MTTAKPLARYSAIEGALASGFATAELHHVWGRDPPENFRPTHRSSYRRHVQCRQVPSPL